MRASTLLSTRAMRSLTEQLEQLPPAKREELLREATARAERALEDAKKNR